MRSSCLALVLALVPALAAAQADALKRARATGDVVRTGTARVTDAADAALAPDPTGGAARAGAAVAPTGDSVGAQPARPPAAGVSGEVDLDAAQASAGAGAAPETYVVQRGDTLWDLSARFLNTPWYWPKLWSYNPQIANPHWIYPGNVLRFHPGTDGQPPSVEVVAAEAQSQPEASADATPADGGYGDEVTVGGRYKIGYVRPRSVRARHDSFVTPGQVEESGVITAAFEEKLLLSPYDRAYARFVDPAKVRPGGTYLLYTKDHEVRHPVTGELFGYRSTIVGAARVVSLDGRTATIEITRAYDPIERGTLIGPWTDAGVRRVRSRPNEKELTGFIIATQQDLVSEIGEHHVVFVDRGRADGVEEGNLFTVVRSGDPYGRQEMDVIQDARSSDLPAEDIGTLMVIDAQQTASAALVVRSLRELYVGDKVEMRVASAVTH